MGDLMLGGADGGNYTLIGATGSVEITPLAVTLTGERTYDATTDAAFGILTVSNAIDPDEVTVASGTATLASKDVGVRAITSMGDLALGGADKDNYTLTGATGSVEITQAPLTITADANVLTAAVDPFTKVFDGLVYSGFTVRYDAFVGGEGPGDLFGTLTFTGPGATATLPGVYVVTPAGLTSTNYLIEFESGSLTIGYGPCSAGYGPGGVILQPINSDGSSVYNRKGGSTIPVKFTVCDASGNPISDPAAVFPVPPVGSITMLNAVRGTVSVVNEPGISDIPDMGFRWAGDKWIFNMATANLQAGTTYTFRINLALASSSIVFRVGVK
jgi:hypothetical protein